MGVDTADNHMLILRRSQADFQNLIMCCFYILTLYESKPKYKINVFEKFLGNLQLAFLRLVCQTRRTHFFLGPS